MRTLIDGYNVMFAAGLMARRSGPDGFRKVRQRFLNDLAATLDPVEAHLTTVVRWASTGPSAAATSFRNLVRTLREPSGTNFFPGRPCANITL